MYMTPLNYRFSGMEKTSDGRWECLVCRSGSYKDVGTGFCKPCPFGTYQV